GTYSDGKLNTRVKSGYMNDIFLELVENGAQEEILWDYKPHVGTDILKVVVKNLREKIIKMGGEFHFNSLVTDILINNNRVTGIKVKNLSSPLQNETIEKFDNVLLGIGHSSRDTYKMLHKNGVFLESKPFAIGARIEHPRLDIDKMQYGNMHEHPNLEAATYSLTYNNKEEERGVFSFCMCPGGVIVNAASENGGTLVNGMSYSTRDGRFSNSALVVGVKANEFGNDIFSGMDFQDKLEKKTYELVENYGALYQNTLDFLKGKKTNRKIDSSYEMEMKSYDLNNLFPEVISNNMKLAMGHWEKTNRNFISEHANLIAPETRTSAPVKITRNELGESVNTKGLYPIGEGAGYAGGIISAAIDGMKIVDLAFTKK
ncbi:NAD(P)/FAD-dependent oxidoreductase, partial [uncultured Cetobacterium sp.]|uniref:NAD(P)/FAD-dependent oxidoreductase n=1 Tax=uncultured Cetobacterium sp. TaxID=527638 RepID=UPI0026222E49